MGDAETLGTIIREMPLHLLKEVLLERPDLIDVEFVTVKDRELFEEYFGGENETTNKEPELTSQG